MLLYIKQPKDQAEANMLKDWCKAIGIKIAYDSIRYSLSYCDYSSWNIKWTSICISTNFKNETWTAKCTYSPKDLDIWKAVLLAK